MENFTESEKAQLWHGVCKVTGFICIGSKNVSLLHASWMLPGKLINNCVGVDSNISVYVQ